jgi:autotransporter-associated beta strand protein
LTGVTTLTASSSLVMSGAVGGAFALTKQGSGSLTLSGANTFTGGLTASAGNI